MRVYFILALAIIYAPCTSAAPHFEKRSKKSQPANAKSDETLIQEQINHNDIRTHYNTDTLNTSLYLSTLTKAHSFAQGMFNGISLESKEWLTNPQHLQTFQHLTTAAKLNPEESRNTLMELDYSLSNSLKKATVIRSTWLLYTTALSNLLAQDAPHQLFFELITNLYLDINLQTVFEKLNHHGMQTVQRVVLKTVVALTGCKRNTKQLKLVNPPDTVLRLLGLMDFVHSIAKIDPAHPGFLKQLDVAVDVSLKLVKEEVELTDGSSIFDDAVETLSTLQFFKLLLPLVPKEFMDRLGEMRYQPPVLKQLFKIPLKNARKHSDILSEIASNLGMAISDFRDSINDRCAYCRLPNSRFLIEHFVVFSSGRVSTKRYSRCINSTTAYLHEEISETVRDFVSELRVKLKELNDPLFTPHSIMFTSNVTIPMPALEDSSSDFDEEPYTFEPFEYPDYQAESDSKNDYISCKIANVYPELKHHHSRTLYTLMHGTKHSGLANIKWVDIVKLIKALGGSVRSVGGSIKMLLVPDLSNRPTRFDEPHPSDRLGWSKAITLRRIFKRWGVSCV